jgi:hypothetical protein
MRILVARQLVLWCLVAAGCYGSVADPFESMQVYLEAPAVVESGKIATFRVHVMTVVSGYKSKSCNWLRISASMGV